MKIPKIIHYCWFGGKPMPPLAMKCIQSWHKYCPDYQIIKWDENNFKIEKNIYTKQAYKAKKYAFVSDYLRLWALYNYGGIYMDVDVELVKNIDVFLNCKVFSGFETQNNIPTGIMGSVPNHKFIGELLSMYDNMLFIKEDGSLDLTSNVVIITEHAIKNYGLKLNNKFQILGDEICIYPSDYFRPSTFPELKIGPNTYAIHYFAGSWLPTSIKVHNKISNEVKKIILKIIGVKNYKKLKTFYYERKGIK